MRKIIHEFLVVLIVTLAILLINNAGVISLEKEIPKDIEEEIEYQRSDKYKNNKTELNEKTEHKEEVKKQYIDPKTAAPVYIGSEENKVNLNTATVEQLITIKGIGEKTADKIIDYRTKNGAFTSIDELVNVKGIGEKKLEKIKEQSR